MPLDFAALLRASALISIPLFSLAGCARPCVDDGLGQSFCPESEDSAGEGNGTGTEGGDGDGDETGIGDGGGCPVLDVELEPLPPTIVLLVDQSGSMTEDFGGQTRWEAVRATRFAPGGVVEAVQDKIRFGLALYTSNADAMTCPLLDETPAAFDNLDAMVAAFDGTGPDGDTPTGESLDLVAADLAEDPAATGQKIVVLATDGEPDTCAEPNPQNGQPEAVAAAENAYALGVRTFIVSVGEDISAGHLQDMANAGAGVQTGQPDAPYYQALDAATLTAAFDDILSNVRECRFEISEALTATSAATCTVTVNGSVVPYDDPDGWILDDAIEIQLVGAACEGIQEGQVSIEMDCDCADVDP